MNTNPYYDDLTVIKTDWLWIGSLLTGFALALGIFLPWATVTIFFGTVDVNGIDTKDAPIFGGVAAAIVICACLRQYAAVFWMGVVGLSLGIYEIVDIHKNKADVEELGASVSIGTGLYLIIISAIAAIVISFIQWDKTRIKN